MTFDSIFSPIRLSDIKIQSSIWKTCVFFIYLTFVKPITATVHDETNVGHEDADWPTIVANIPPQTHELRLGQNIFTTVEAGR